MATLEELKTELGEEKTAVIDAAIEAEKNRGIEASRKKGQEVTKWMTEANKAKDALRDIGVDVSSDFAAQVESIKAKIQAASESGAKLTETEKAFKTQLDQINKHLADERAEKDAAKKQLSHATIREQLSKAFGDTVYGIEDTIDLMILKGKAKLTDSGSVVVADGEEELDISAAVEAFKKANPNRVKNNSRPGSGSAPQSEQKNAKVLTKAQYETMSVKDRAAFFLANPGAKVVD